MSNFGGIKQDSDKYTMNTYARFPVAISNGENATCYDFDGKKYIDFGSGIGVTSLGYGNKRWADAVAKQALSLSHTSNLYYTKPYTDLAKIMMEKTGFSKVFFANSGAEANEGAIKLARKRSFDKYGTGRSEIITLVNSFHGRTVTTIAATGQDVFHNYFFPFTEGFAYATANDISDVKAKVSDKTCAIMIELVQGEGGVMPLEKEFVKQIEALCMEQDLTFIVDEVQTGVGRTGTFYCFEQYDIKPNVITSAKGLGGGLPIGAVLADEKCADVLGPGQHATTYGGNAICCAGALVVMSELYDGGLLKEVSKKGDYIREKLSTIPHVKQVRGMGLMIGIEIDESIKASDVVALCVEKGLLILTAKTILRMLPPLSITKEEIDLGMEILDNVLSSL